jgi:hypothetical protein
LICSAGQARLGALLAGVGINGATKSLNTTHHTKVMAKIMRAVDLAKLFHCCSQVLLCQAAVTNQEGRSAACTSKYASAVHMVTNSCFWGCAQAVRNIRKV